MGSYLSWLVARPPGSLVKWWSHVVLKLMGGRAKLTAGDFRRRIARERSQPLARPASWLLGLLYGVTFTELRFRLGHTERSYYVVRPRESRRRLGAITLLYLHGGAYTSEAIVHHYNLVAVLAHELGCTVYLPHYPLAPEHTCREVQAWVDAFYGSVVVPAAAGPSARVVVAGDSAGGGLALALAQRLAAAAPAPPPVRAPDSLLLFSPWLDATVSAADVRRLERDDPLLGVDWLVEAGRMFMDAPPSAADPNAGGACPLWGPLAGLPPTSLWIGTHDVLLAECRHLRDRWAASASATTAAGPAPAATTGVLQYHERAGLTHVWVAILGMPEAAQAVAEAVAAVAEDCGGDGR